jgi:hypothetical protein
MKIDDIIVAMETIAPTGRMKVFRDVPTSEWADEVASFLGRISYKRNWRARVCASLDPETALVKLEHDEFDADRWLEISPHVHATVIYPFTVHRNSFRNEAHFIEDFPKLLLMKIRDAEDHEVAEWLRLDGRHVKDPHPELRTHLRYEGMFSMTADRDSILAMLKGIAAT